MVIALTPRGVMLKGITESTDASDNPVSAGSTDNATFNHIRIEDH
ncbi:hypothetical protein HMPREF0290_2324 [Corynebacterium efficiens YS-314]|nr:hypothetical protein HMPREF0290_2324 [Corynebacterium efficiens YS-314]